MVILDTCAVIEIAREKPALSTRAMKIIAKGVYILSISFAEIACKIKLKRLEIGIEVDDLFDEFSRIPSVEIVDIGVPQWLESIELDWPENRDPADRLIAAFAVRKKIAIVTSDRKIKKFYNNIIW